MPIGVLTWWAAFMEDDDFDDGWDMRATLVDGRWVERSPRSPEIEPQARREVEFLPWLAPQVPLPIPIPFVVSEQPLVLRHTFLPGDRCPGTSAAHGRAIGRFLRTLHAVDTNEAVAHGLQDAEAAQEARQASHHRLAQRILPLMPEVVRSDGEELLARSRHLAPPTCVVHADLGLDHIRVVGDAVTGVIDWGDSCVGDPALDLAATTLETEPEFAHAVLATYLPSPEVMKRARDWHMLDPWHTALFGLDSHDDALVELGLTEAVERLTSANP